MKLAGYLREAIMAYSRLLDAKGWMVMPLGVEALHPKCPVGAADWLLLDAVLPVVARASDDDEALAQ
jgi:hypothetical protein